LAVVDAEICICDLLFVETGKNYVHTGIEGMCVCKFLLHVDM